MSRTVISTDIVGCGAGGTSRQVYLDEQHEKVLDRAIAAVKDPRYPIASAFRRPDGDSTTLVVDADVARSWLIADFLLREVAIALAEVNRTADERHRLRLRIAADYGETVLHPPHVGGDAVVHAARLRDAPALREAMAKAPHADFGLIVSRRLHEVVRRSERGLDPAQFAKVHVVVKDFSDHGWIYLPTASGPVPLADLVEDFDKSAGAEGNTRRRHRRVTGVLGDRDVELVLAHHVPPPCQREAEQALGEDHVVIVEGPRGVGKRSAAIGMLRGRTQGPLVVLSPASTPTELANQTYQTGHGYLIADQVDTAKEPDAGFLWHPVRDAVRNAGAYLVVTRREPIRELQVVTSVAWQQPPLEDVVHAHLAGAEHAAAELLATLPTGCTMTEIAKVTARVAAGDPVADALPLLDRTADDVVRSWFEAARTPREILDVTALAFSTGATGPEFESRRAALTNHAMVGDADSTGLDGNSLVTTGGSGPAFTDSGHRNRVLAELAARQPKSFWNGVFAWLEEIVRAGADLPVAFGLAGLARADAATVENSVLEPWSAGRLGWSGQTTAAFVLWAMCLDEPLVPTALRIVRGWVRGSSAQRQTAALALSGELGARFPSEAVQGLRRLLEQSPRGDDTYVDALGTLFATLEADGDDGATVLVLLGGLLDDVEQDRSSPGMKDRVLRSVLATLTARNALDDEPAISSFLRAQPDQTRLVSRLSAAVLADPTYLSDAVQALLAGVSGLKPEHSQVIRQHLADDMAAPVPVPQPTRTRPTPVPLPDIEADQRRYPIVVQRRLDTTRGRVLAPRRRELPETAAHEVLVFHVDGGHLLADRRKQATHVSVVDMSADRSVRVDIAIRSADTFPFIALVRFACTVFDPVAVVRKGIDDAEKRLRDHLHGHHRLLELGRGRELRDVDHVRCDVTAWVRASLEIRPISLPGLDIAMSGIEVHAPVTLANERDTTDNEGDDDVD